MSDLRLWILVLSTVSFFAGVAGGVVLSTRDTDREQPPFHDYEARFVREFELDAERSRSLRVVLANYDRDLENIEAAHLAATYRDMEPELERLGIRYNDLIRNRVLPPSKRPRFDQLAAAFPVHQDPNR